MPTAADLNAAIRDVPNFPKEGILFKDITPVLGDAELFKASMDLLAETAQGEKIDKVVGIAGVAQILGAGFVPIRKKGKLPWTTHKMAYSLEYGEDCVEIHKDAIKPGEKVLLVDDLLATGGTTAAAIKLLKVLDADLIATSFLIELEALNGRALIDSPRTEAILTY